nr:transposase [Aliiruegeria haliotis]
MFVSVPPKLAISDLVRKMKGGSSFKVQREFPAISKCYWGCRFWGRGYVSTTNGAIHCPTGHSAAMSRRGRRHRASRLRTAHCPSFLRVPPVVQW